MNEYVNFNDLIGKTLKEIDVDRSNDIIKLRCEDGYEYHMFHDQDCCESVTIEDICGDVNDLIGSPIVLAEEAANSDNPKDEYDESFTWTFYKIATAKGYVTIRWYGESNGYYSESVAVKKVLLSALSVDINVVQKPVTVQFDCPHCEEEIAIDYQDFCDDIGEPCDWECTKIECPKCDKPLKIHSIDWD